jgi:hypothetical protein
MTSRASTPRRLIRVGTTRVMRRLALPFETSEASGALNKVTKPSSTTEPAPVMKDNRSERS